MTLSENVNADRSDVLLTSVFLAGGIKSKRKLNTLVFIIQEKLKSTNKEILNYKFYDTITGPYSLELMEDIEVLANAGFVSGSNKRNLGEFTHYYSLTDFGEMEYKWIIEKNTPDDVKEDIRKVIDEYRNMHAYEIITKLKENGEYVSLEPEEKLNNILFEKI
ncbi:MAG: hypothetical protein CVT89_03730 [Candidatus Altiarchaeales archaeon HGW-Altiarchaeales-2]|nr:MAG: hypothetical protein CVT89_03730 [Candidatus Altiarchaeales archaeon HGW-Altiarchaeales-2]